MAKKVIEQGKALLSSKTFWFNLLFVLVSVASMFGFKEFQPDEKTVSLLGGVAAIVNILLRLKTNESITRLK